MKSLSRHDLTHRSRLLFFLAIFIPTTQAANITGVAGYTLGDVLDKGKVLDETKSDDGETIYTVKPLGSVQQFDLLTLRLTQKQQIHRISAFSPILSAADCETRMTKLRKQTEKQFPTLGYYAMDQSELFYEADRTYTLECIKSNRGIRLLQEYSDDKLAAQK
jgi:hypothetical protein